MVYNICYKVKENLKQNISFLTGDAGRPGQPQPFLIGTTCHPMSLSTGAHFKLTNTQIVKTCFQGSTPISPMEPSGVKQGQKKMNWLMSLFTPRIHLFPGQTTMTLPLSGSISDDVTI